MGKLSNAYFVSGAKEHKSCFFYDRMIYSASNTWELKSKWFQNKRYITRYLF